MTSLNTSYQQNSSPVASPLKWGKPFIEIDLKDHSAPFLSKDQLPGIYKKTVKWVSTNKRSSCLIIYVISMASVFAGSVGLILSDSDEKQAIGSILLPISLTLLMLSCACTIAYKQPPHRDVLRS